MSSNETFDNAIKLAEMSVRDVSLTFRQASRKACRPVKKASTSMMLAVGVVNGASWLALQLFFKQKQPNTHPNK